MDPALRASGSVQIAGMNRPGMLAKGSAIPGVQRCLYFRRYRERHLLRTFRADI